MGGQVNLTLADIEAYRGQGSGARSGKYLRYYCPIHGGDHQRSLSLDPDTGRFHCFACGAWGYLEEKRQEWIQERKKEGVWRPSEGRTGRRDRVGMDKCIGATEKPVISPSGGPGEPKERPELARVLQELQAALPGSLGEEYLRRRGIPLELAQACGVGYAAPGKWPHKKNGRPVRQWKWGRLVFPHTNPAGEVVNLYGRAVGSNEKVPKEERHDHLPGPKGIFNARALNSDTVFICEGVFDALSLMAAGYHDAVAIFGVDGLRWEWVKAKRVVFCLDQDEAGERWRDLAWEGVLRGKEAYFLPPAAYGGHKDLNEAWMAAGRLDIGAWEEPGWDIGGAVDRKEPQISGETGAEQGQKRDKTVRDWGPKNTEFLEQAYEPEPTGSNQPEPQKKENDQGDRPKRTEPNEPEGQKRNGEWERIKRIESRVKKESAPVVDIQTVDIQTGERPAQNYSRCFACGGARWWISFHGVRICARCHPPARPDLVARWEGEQGEHLAG